MYAVPDQAGKLVVVTGANSGRPVDVLIPGAVNGGYYGPSRWFGLVGPATAVRAPRLTGAALPAGAARPR